MIQFTEAYSWKQAAVIGKFTKLRIKLQMISFAIETDIDNVYCTAQKGAMEGMTYFANRLEENWQLQKENLSENFPKFYLEKRLRISIDGEPIGEQIRFDKFIGFDYEKQDVNVRDYTNCDLAHSLLEPPYGLNFKINHQHGTPEYYDVKTKEYSAIYRIFLDDFILLSEYKKDDLVVHRWSDDWSNFFDAGKEWWGNYYWTVYNKRNNTIIVLGASETD